MWGPRGLPLWRALQAGGRLLEAELPGSHPYLQVYRLGPCWRVGAALAPLSQPAHTKPRHALKEKSLLMLWERQRRRHARRRKV